MNKTNRILTHKKSKNLNIKVPLKVHLYMHVDEHEYKHGKIFAMVFWCGCSHCIHEYENHQIILDKFRRG